MAKATREDALKVAKYLGCRGAHQRDDGNWVPCADEATLMRLSNRAEQKTARRKKKRWEQLRERGVLGIETLPGGGLVSERISMAKSYMEMRHIDEPGIKQVPWSEQSDVFEVKGIGRRWVRNQRFNPNAEDGDEDGTVQDGTPYQRPAPVKKPSTSAIQERLEGMDGPASPRTSRAKPKPVTASTTKNKLGLSPMLDEPQDTQAAFNKGGRRYTDERYNKVHKPIFDAIMKTVTKRRPQGQPKTMYVLGGPSGSYKTSMRREGFQGIPGTDAAAHIDPDEIKEMLPEYDVWAKQGRTDVASLVHRESRDLGSSAVDEAMKKDLDIVYDTSGLFSQGFGLLRRAKQNGYKVVAHYATGDTEKFLAGVKARGKATGRNVPSSIVRSLAGRIPGAARAANKRGYFDEWHLWDTTDAGKRIPVARKMGNSKLEILDQKLWDRYANGGY